VAQGKYDDAFSSLFAAKDLEQDESDLLLIKLLSKTGVSHAKLGDENIEKVVSRLIMILSRREFVEVILPWLSALAKTVSIEQLGELLECMLGLL